MPLYLPKKWIQRNRKSSSKNLWTWKQFYALTNKNLFFNFKEFDHHWKLLKTLDLNAYQGFLILFLIQLSLVISKNLYMKYLKDETPQLWSIKPANILNSFGVKSWKSVILGDFLQRKGDFITGVSFFLLSPTWKWIFTKVLNHKCL